MTLPVQSNYTAALLPPPQLKCLAELAVHGPAYSQTAIVWGSSKVAVTEHDTILRITNNNMSYSGSQLAQ